MKLNSSSFLLLVALAACTAPVQPSVTVSRANLSATTEAPATPQAVARPTVAPVTQPPFTTMPEPTIRQIPADPAVLANPDVVRVLDYLKQRGISLGEPHESRAAFLYPVKGAAYAFAQGWLHIHPFADAQAAEARASQIPSELARSIADWIGPPHYFRCRSAIAVYYGSDVSVIAALRDVCGPELASEPNSSSAPVAPIETGWSIESEPLAVATAAPTRAPTLAPAQFIHQPSVAHLLRNRPAQGQRVEVDAYFSGVNTPPFSSPPPPRDQVACPLFTASRALTDRPFLAVLMYLNTQMGNSLPEDAAWLIAVTPDEAKPGVHSMPQLPYHARFRGHFGDPAFSKCEHTDHIFMIEQVVTVYEQNPPDPTMYQLKPPSDYSQWPRYDNKLGYNLPYPPDWHVEKLDDVTLMLKGPQWQDNPVLAVVHKGETHYDQYNPSALPPLMQGQGFGIFEQGNWSAAPGNNPPAPQHLAGYEVEQGQSAGTRSVSVLFSGNGYTYELRLTYPTGFATSQALLTNYTAIVEGFALAKNPGPTPTAPINQALGNGPFITQDQALTIAGKKARGKLELLGAQLASEQAARNLADACSTFAGHPQGVWVLVVHGALVRTTRTMRLYVDAKTGDQLCGEELVPGTTPLPTMPPSTTATPVKK